MHQQDIFGTKISASHITNATPGGSAPGGATPGGSTPAVSRLARYVNMDQSPYNGATTYSAALQSNAVTQIHSNIQDISGFTQGLPTPPDSARCTSVFAPQLGTGLQQPPPQPLPPLPPLPTTDPNPFPAQLDFPRTPGSKARSQNRPVRMFENSSYPPSKQPTTCYQPWVLCSNQESIPTVTMGPPQFDESFLSEQCTPLSHRIRPSAVHTPVYRSFVYQEPYAPSAEHHRSAWCIPELSKPRAIVGQSADVRRTLSYPESPESVALAVSNLDYNITDEEWIQILHRTFQTHVQVINVRIQKQQDGSTLALIDLHCEEDARYAISQCHRQKIGYKRIQVSMHTPESPNNAQRIRHEVASILSEVSGHGLPLFKFIELYEKRFYRSISVSDLYHMKDTVEIKENTGSGNGRIVCLQSTLALPGYLSSKSSSPDLNFSEAPYCTLHCSQSDYTLIEESGMLPFVKIDLKSFNNHVHTLLRLHDGELYLMSFQYCYSAAYCKLKPTAEGGVPLEHLISCVTGVFIRIDNLGVKKVVLQESRPSSPNSTIQEVSIANESFHSRPSHPLNQQLSQFSREVVDLLKRMPGCQMSFSKFIPSYHHHFGRQCRVADFGFTKLLELFEAIPHVLQILGTGNQRILYLTHRIHLRRFSADLCRVLKAQPEKQCSIEQYPERYSEVIGTDLSVTSFGVCYISDMLMEVSESQVLVTGSGDSAIMCIPKKDQTPEEMERTKQFGYEVIDLLKNCPQCTMAFNKFIPSYHHHFGRQCRVADYGFTKLLELFEAIPDVVSISESGEERFIALTKTELYKVLSEQILALLKNSLSHAIEIKELGPCYQKEYGHNIYIEEFGVTSLEELIEKIPHIAVVEKCDGVDTIKLLNKVMNESLARRCLELLMTKSEGAMRLSKFIKTFNNYFSDSPDLVEVKHELFPAIMITEDETSGTIYLHPLLSIARRIMILLTNNQGKLTLLNFEMAYRQSFGASLNSLQCGYPGVAIMLQIMDFMVSVRGRGNRQTILLRQDYISRLAHQLAYKVGIYTEIVKYKDLTKDHKPSAACDDGILGLCRSIARSHLSNVYSAGKLTSDITEARKAISNVTLAQRRKSHPCIPVHTLSVGSAAVSSAPASPNTKPVNVALLSSNNIPIIKDDPGITDKVFS